MRRGEAWVFGWGQHPWPQRTREAAELSQPGEETQEAMRCFLLCPHSGSTNRSWALLTHHRLQFPRPCWPSPDLQPCSHHRPQLGEPGLDQKQALGIPLGTGLD